MAQTQIIPGFVSSPFHNGAYGLCVHFYDIDGLASYTTGGQVILSSALGMKRIFFAQAMAANDSSNTVQVAGIGKKLQASIKLIWLVSSTGAEVANAVNLSSKACKLMVVGIDC